MPSLNIKDDELYAKKSGSWLSFVRPNRFKRCAMPLIVSYRRHHENCAAVSR